MRELFHHVDLRFSIVQRLGHLGVIASQLTSLPELFISFILVYHINVVCSLIVYLF